jgi:hypothetical protein
MDAVVLGAGPGRRLLGMRVCGGLWWGRESPRLGDEG